MPPLDTARGAAGSENTPEGETTHATVSLNGAPAVPAGPAWKLTPDAPSERMNQPQSDATYLKPDEKTTFEPK